MRLATTVSPLAVKMRDVLDDIKQNVVVVTQTTRRGKKNRVMATTNLTGKAAYLHRLINFQNVLAVALPSGMSEEDQKKYSAISVYFEQGRKFDKIMVAKYEHGSPETTAEVRYFVNKATEEIFGAKSPLAPNERWYFGTLSSINLWDWSKEPHGTPIDPAKAGVREVGAYGKYRHFEKAS
jgi:hypothetical protein